MPGRGSYGPGGKWIHDRAHRILEKGELQKQYGDRAKQVAYALATQQAHKMKKTPKKKGGYGTPVGRAVARAKFQKPRKEYRKTASAWNRILVKTAAVGGQDLRSFKPVAGTFPTDDSKGHANKLLNQSQNAAEVGPNPAFTTLKPKGPTLQDVSVKMPSPKGSLPKIGSAGGIMDEKIKNDPLVQYIRKEAGLDPASADQAMATTNDVLRTLFTGPKTKRKFDEKDVEKLPDKW